MTAPAARSSRRNVGLLALIAMAVSVMIGACSSSDGSPSGGALSGSSSVASGSSSSAQVCEDYQALQDSISRLTSLKLTAVGTDGVKAAVDDVASSLATLRSSAKGQFSSQIDGLDKAISDIQSTLGSLGSGGSLTSVLGTLVTQVAAVGTAAAALKSAVGSACPGSSRTS